MTDEEQETTGVVGSLREENGRGVVRMEDTYDTDIADLWTALTDVDRLARWIAVVEGDARLGGLVQAHFTSGFDGQCRVDVCEPERRLLVSVNLGQVEGTVIEATLTREGDRTRLVIEERGLPLDEYAAHGAGWQAHVEDLRALLSGRQPSDWNKRWSELESKYELLAENLK
jgi:uncharacterized protein YndB with AHSA1/START domain